ncbi:MAG: UvrD-helicase domain-containing protein, partial [Gammaproteobacteria bacterium]|nr:UvrD-helicase domain-containing protein [Gammaproteobacteria bacterium]
AVMEQALKHIVEASLKDVRNALLKADAEELADCAGYAADNLGEDNPRSSRGLPGTNADARQDWQFIADLCLTQRGEWRKSVTIKQGFPPGRDGRDMKEQFTDLLSRFSEQPRLLELFREIPMLPPTAYQDDEWLALKGLYVLLTRAKEQLRRLCAARNQVDFIGLAEAASQALGDDDNPTDLALYLDYRLRHILVDEYQDVSNNQQELLEKLTAGWAAEDGHSLFLVGDPMQSIYRFRKAEVGVFLNTWQQQQLGQVPIEAVTIEVNFRSDPALVNWVNQAFAQVLPKVSDSARGAVKFKPAQAFRELSGTTGVYVHPVLIPKMNKDEDPAAAKAQAQAQEAQLVLQQIDAIRAESPADCIAILVRARTHLSAILPLLAERKIPFRAVDLEPLGARPVIQDLLTLTRALRHRADRVAWLGLLRAPWCGLSLADLLALAGDSSDQTIWQCLQNEQRRATLSAAGRTRLERLYALLSQAFARQGRLPFRRWVEGLWLNLGGPATLASETDLRDARRYFELLDELEQGGDLPSQEALAQRVTELYAGADTHANDSLQIMTVHGAKGLEFDHVILPGLQRTAPTDPKQLLVWSENPYPISSEPTRSDLLLAPVKASDGTASPIYDFIASLEQSKQRYEQGRLLYVAATRARKQLHLIGSVKVQEGESGPELAAPSDKTPLGQLWPVVKKVFQDGMNVELPKIDPNYAAAVTRRALLKRLPADWQLPDPPARAQWTPAPATGATQADTGAEGGTIEYQWAGRAIKHVGSVVHQYLQLMTARENDPWNTDKISAHRPQYRQALDTLGVPAAELDTACAWVEQALNGILADPKGQWLLAAHKEEQSEYALSGVYGGTVVNIVIDRTFVDEAGVRWIVDYKASRHESRDVEQFLDLQQERYRAQLEKYAAVLAALDQRPIRLGLYFPLLRGWREWA